MTVGKRLREIRKDNLLTQQDIADELHVTRQTVSSWETGRSYPDISSLIRLATVYGLSLDTLLLEDAVATANVVRQDEQRKDARIVYYVSFLFSMVLSGLVILNALKIPIFRLTTPVSFIMVSLSIVNCFTIGPSYRRYRKMLHKRVERTLSMGSVVASLVVIAMLLGATYLLKGWSGELLGGAMGGFGTLIVMVIYHRVKYGPMRKSWDLW